MSSSSFKNNVRLSQTYRHPQYNLYIKYNVIFFFPFFFLSLSISLSLYLSISFSLHIFLSSGRVDTAIWMHYMNAN